MIMYNVYICIDSSKMKMNTSYMYVKVPSDLAGNSSSHLFILFFKQVPVGNIEECNEACQKSDTCKFFTFYFQRGMASCFLLKNCSKKVRQIQTLTIIQDGVS